MEPDIGSSPRGTSVPYGQACSGCSKAKCRCIKRGSAVDCDRCIRLKKECRPSTVVRKRPAQSGARSKTKHLEEKLNDIISLLKSEAEPTSLHDPERSEPHNSRNRSELQSICGASEQPESRPSGSTLCYPSPASTGGRNFDRAEEHLNTFKSFHLKHFPFVHIPDEMSAAQLQRERPFLWLNIYGISCKSINEQKKIEQEIREVISRKLIVDMERSMDLLLGLITYLTWYSNMDKNKKMLCMTMSLATSLVVDLCLDRKIGQSVCKETSSLNAYHGYWKTTEVILQRTNEERRAVLACYSTCTSISSFLRSPLMRWTPHMEECLMSLSRSPETPGDEILVLMVKLSRIVEDVTVATCWRLSDPETPDVPKSPPYLLIKVLQKRLGEIRLEVAPHLLKHSESLLGIGSVIMVRSLANNEPTPEALMGSLDFTELIINDLPLYPVLERTQAPDQPLLTRILCADLCIAAARRCLDMFFSLVPAESFAATMPMHLQFARCTHIAYRLSMTVDPAWDRHTIRSILNVTEVLERAAQHFGSVPEAIGLQSDGDDSYRRFSAAMRHAIPIWTKVISEADGDAYGSSAREQAEALVDVGFNDLSMMDFSGSLFTDGMMPEMFYNN